MEQNGIRDNSIQARQRPDLSNRHYINDEIRCSRIVLLDEEGQKMGEFSKEEALALGEKETKDVIQIGYNPNDRIVIAKLMDIGKFMYAQKREENAKKKQQVRKGMKEIKFGYNIGSNDLQLKIKKAEEALGDGYDIKVVAVLRGREKMYKENILLKVKEVEEKLSGSSKSQGIKDIGNGYTLILFAKVK